MGNKVADAGTRLSVIAIAKEENTLKAVELREYGGSFEILWAKSSEVGQTDWCRFAAECGLSLGPAAQKQTDSDKVVVVGFDSAGVAFYHIDVPAVKEEEIAPMVRLQTEARLPLPAEQIELAWRAGAMQNGQVPVTIAAARREHLQKFVENISGFGPAKILLDCEGIVRAWRAFFSGNEKQAVVVSVGSRNTQVCLAENGRVSNVAVLDMGIEDFSGAGALTAQTENTERFAQDVRSVFELFGYGQGLAELPVFVLPDGSGATKRVVSCLKSAGLNVQAALPDIERSIRRGGQTELGVEDIYEYRVPIGLALCAFEARTDELNIFENLYNPAREEKKKHWLYSPKVAAVIAAVMLALLVIVSYAVDVAGPGAIEKRLKTAASDSDIDLFMQRQKLIKTVARERPDLLDLLNQVGAGGDKGMLLDSLHFKKGQRVSIKGQAQNSDQLYKFQETLLSKKGIKDVKIRNATQDSKSKKLTFTITFHYRNFTGKKTQL